MPKHRSVQTKIRWTHAEHEQAISLCPERSLAPWLRELALAAGRPSRKIRSAKADPILLLQISKIGNNFNQVARRLNVRKDLTQSERTRLFHNLADIQADLRVIALRQEKDQPL